MKEIKKGFTLNIAHLHPDNPNLHGHTFRIFVTANGIFEDENDSALNLSELTCFVEAKIINILNDAFLYNEKSKYEYEQEIAKILIDNNKKTLAFNGIPSTSRIADYIFKTLNFNCVIENKLFRISCVEIVDTPLFSVIVKDND